MKEYNENKWTKIVFACMSLPLCAIALWIILYGETIFVSFAGVAMLALFLYTLINPFVHKVVLDDQFIAEKSLFRKKRILFENITQINIQSYFAEIISGKEKIQIAKFAVEDSGEIIGSVISKTKDNNQVLFYGDPISFQSYVNEFSDTKSLAEYDESDSTSFTFVEKAELVERRWLFRVVNLTTSKGTFKITYFGRGAGYECVFVNDDLVSKQDSHLWYVPKFAFKFQGMNISVNVRIYPWLTIRKFWIEIDNRTVYSE